MDTMIFASLVATLIFALAIPIWGILTVDDNHAPILKISKRWSIHIMEGIVVLFFISASMLFILKEQPF